MTLTWKLEDRRTYRTMQKSSPIWVSKRYIKLSRNLVLTLNKGDKLFIFLFYWQPSATEIDLGIFWLKRIPGTCYTMIVYLLEILGKRDIMKLSILCRLRFNYRCLQQSTSPKVQQKSKICDPSYLYVSVWDTLIHPSCLCDKFRWLLHVEVNI